MLKRGLWVVLGLAALALAAFLASPFLMGGDPAYQLSVPAEQRSACQGLTDDEAVARARAWFSAKSERQRSAPVWQGRDPTQLDVLSVERTNVTVVVFGEGGQRLITAFIYDDCMVGWG